MILGSDGGGEIGQNFRGFPGMSLSVMLIPLATGFCNGSRLSDPACIARAMSTNDDQRQIGWKPNDTYSWQPLGEVDILLATGLSSLDNGDNITTGTTIRRSQCRAWPSHYQRKRHYHASDSCWAVFQGILYGTIRPVKCGFQSRRRQDNNLPSEPTKICIHSRSLCELHRRLLFKDFYHCQANLAT